ncbi:hypothetical protein PG988_016168 [Apiospora saccharicola]
MTNNNMSPESVHPGPNNPADESRSEESTEPKARKACINCRRQKMKCRIDNGNTCRRCHRSGVPCIFVPRANAAGLPINLGMLDPSQAEINKTVMRRLKMIEDYLGFSAPDDSLCMETDPSSGGRMEEDEPETPEDHALNALWMAAASLEKICPPSVGGGGVIWQRSMIKQLWLRFHETMPRLHFLPSKQTFSSPRPVLLASILYCSSARGTPEHPGKRDRAAPDHADVVEAEEWAFQTVLGIILAGLLTEAYVRETGIWISVAYRLILEHCPPHVDERSREWRRLFSGCQIVDLEHASLHLSCPIIPIEAPLPTLRISPRDQLYRLSRMMHTGLAHFTGRGLPTIWSCFTSGTPPDATGATCAFSAVDAAVIRDWARQLDEWLVDFSSNSGSNTNTNAHDSSLSSSAMSEQDRALVFRQYVLHRLVVLSIYHPARGCNLYSNSITPHEQFELLLSARATLRLHLNDKSIWSNWDFVMITWAALIVLQAVEGGAGELDDLTNIRIHLEMLRQTNEPRPSLRDKLITRLEQSLETVQTPSPTALRDSTVAANAANLQSPLSPTFDYSWQIFDQASLQQVTYPAWPLAPQLQGAGL